jgi:hypothetical protein
MVACADKGEDSSLAADSGAEAGAGEDGGGDDGGTTDDGGAGDDGGAADDGGGSDGGEGDGGGSDEGGDGGTTGIELAGSWLDNWGGDHEISDALWSSYAGSSLVHLSGYDNEANYAVGQNDEANAYNPELWSRFDWTVDSDGTLWFCQSAYDSASEEEALAVPMADPTNPAASGCGGFAWSSLSPA